MHSTNTRIIILLFLSLIIASFTPFKQLARAQSTPPDGITIPPNTPERIEETIPKPTETPLPSKPEPSLPPALQIPATDTPTAPTTPINERINVKKIEVLGNTVLFEDINKLIKEYENCSKQACSIPFEDLVQLRSSITQLYIDNGYITSGAFILNNQPLESGIIEIQVVEGELERIEINELNRLQQNYVRSRLRLATKPPLNRKRLESALQLLQLDPLLQQVNAELIAGSTPGKNILQLQLKEAPAFNAGIVIDNNQSPTIGSLQGIVFASYNNLLGLGDQLSAEYGLTDGLDIYGLSYTIPVNARYGTFNIRYSNNNSQIIEEQFADLGIRSDSQSLSFGFRQPLVKKADTELALGLALDIRRSQTFLLDDEPFSFSEGPEDGKSKVTAIRFSQEWLQRNAKQVLAARSQFSFGIDAFDATINESGIDGRFFIWLGQFQWVQQVSPKTLMIAKINAQLTPDGLLPIEKISLGGVDTVRGYRQNELVTDNGILGSVELRLPLTSDNSLQIRPFFDIGTVWNNKAENPDPQTVAGLGLGLSWQPRRDLFLQLDYGIPLIAVEDQGDSLQENGVYFSLRYQPF
ncbi:MAG: ShlB/FhaC/HecB family hemolysin secretion/activation protein [Nostocales cyanobacterium 94392]|nr:ShlB/FhaC/HecB family hemolysin secretion/activation protein [Nostocales cyanobacterium 94392]